MERVTIYKFQVYDVHTDDMRESSRWGTLSAIEKIPGAQILGQTKTDVDPSVIASDIRGLTAKGWNPPSPNLVQSSVKN
jgi:hypothetical protein